MFQLDSCRQLLFKQQYVDSVTLPINSTYNFKVQLQFAFASAKSPLFVPLWRRQGFRFPVFERSKMWRARAGNHDGASYLTIALSFRNVMRNTSTSRNLGGQINQFSNGIRG